MKRNLLKFRLQFRKKNLLRLFLNPNETPLRKSVAMALGVFIGVIPIWGGQIIGGLASAQYFKLNKPLVVIGTYINLTPLFPLIAFLSLKLGFLLANQSVSLPAMGQINFELLQTYFWYFLLGTRSCHNSYFFWISHLCRYLPFPLIKVPDQTKCKCIKDTGSKHGTNTSFFRKQGFHIKVL
jgi:hypothetical protein